MATFNFKRTAAGIGSNGQQLAILGLSKLVVLLIKRVFYLSFKKNNYYRLYRQVKSLHEVHKL